MGLRLHNTLTRAKDDFVPIDPANVRMYVCGPTVYDFAHIGNARPLIVFDVLFRLLRHLYGADHVTYVRNITDVDDKINARAAQEYPGLPLNDAIRQVTERTERQFHEDVKALGCLPPTFEPRATEYISNADAPEDMIRMIGKLIDKGNAYVEQGHLLFKVDSMPDYGKLANRSLDDMIAGARVDVAPYKHGPMDFVLWKPSKDGEPAWPSPWGMGRPGWHIECSAMAGALLGETFDIHGGGIDLVFPHHENELAQSRCAHGTHVMANYWLHNGFLQVEGEKMSKSLGNFVTIREVLKDWPGPVVRLNMLKTHYRQPIDWTVRGLEECLKQWNRWLSITSVGPTARVDTKVIALLGDDLNTWSAIKRIEELCKLSDGAAERELFVGSARLMGLLEAPTFSTFIFPAHGPEVRPMEELRTMVDAFPSSMSVADLRAFVESKETTFNWVAQIQSSILSLMLPVSPQVSLWDLKLNLPRLIELNHAARARAAARAAKDFAAADDIRSRLDAMGIQLKDAKDPKTGELVTTWEVKR